MVHLMVGLAGRKAVVGVSSLQGSVPALTKAKVAFAVLDVAFAVLCLGTSIVGAIGSSALSTLSTDFVSSLALRRSSHSMALRRIVRGRNAILAALLAVAIPIAAAVVAFGALMSSAPSGVIDHKYTRPSDKASSQPRVERAFWNAAALQKSFDTDCFGAGRGNVWASSVSIAALANLGLPFCFLAGLASTGAGRAAPRRAGAPPPRIALRAAANAATLGGLRT